MTHPNIEFAIQYLEERGAIIPPEILLQLKELGYPISDKNKKILSENIAEKKINSRSIKQAVSYQPIRNEMWAAVYDAVYGFLSGNSQVATYNRTMSTAISKAYIETLDIAYVDGGGSLPVDTDTVEYAKSELNAQLGYVDSLFSTLKQLRKEKDFDAISESFAKANSWASALDGFYNAIRLVGAGNKMLTWNLGNTEKHCDTCLSLNDQRHRASWYSSRGYFPRKPGSSTDCGGYHCDCKLVDDNGDEFTI